MKNILWIKSHSSPFNKRDLEEKEVFKCLVEETLNSFLIKVVPYSVWRSNFVFKILAVWQIGGHSFSGVWKTLMQRTHSSRILTSQPFTRPAVGRKFVFFVDFTEASILRKLFSVDLP